MTYCTLEEAWGTEFKKKKKRKTTNSKEKIETFISNSNDNDTNENISKDRYRYDFSRTEQPLLQHNGNEERIKIEDNYVIGENDQTIDNIKEEVMEEYQEHLNNIREEDEEESITNTTNVEKKESILIEKINTLLNQIENSQGNTMNEIILFTLLGIFIIFIMDTFVKIGKLSH